MAYSLSPERNSLRVIVTSSKSSASARSALSKASVISATPRGRRLLVPLKMTSSILLPRRYLTRCSPKTQRTASEILLFPDPFGPTMAVMPAPNSRFVRSAKDLKPKAVTDFKNKKDHPVLM